jgi:hypothetical protein
LTALCMNGHHAGFKQQPHWSQAIVTPTWQTEQKGCKSRPQVLAKP